MRSFRSPRASSIVSHRRGLLSGICIAAFWGTNDGRLRAVEVGGGHLGIAADSQKRRLAACATVVAIGQIGGGFRFGSGLRLRTSGINETCDCYLSWLF